MINVLQRLAELDSVNPNVVKENQNLPVATSAPYRSYDLETTILNPAYVAWENSGNDEINPPPEEIEVGINYSIASDSDETGRYSYIEDWDVYDLSSGQQITINDKNVESDIKDKIWKTAEQNRDADFNIPDKYDEDMSNQGNLGAHGEETISPIHGGQRKEETMENLNLESLRYLAGVKETIAECGMPTSSGSPASINITAGSGQELTGMLKDIMNLAGVSKVEPHHMPVDNPDAGPSTVISAPPMSGVQQDPNVEMHKLMAIVGEPDMDQDSMNSGEQDGEGNEKEMDEDNDRMYDTSPDEVVMSDPMAQYGDINSGDHRERQKGLPVAKPMEATFKQLYAEYEKFIAEGATMQAKGPKEADVPAYLRKQKRPGQDAAQSATDKRNEKSGSKVWSSKRTQEGAVKQAAADIADKKMSDADFKKKYGKTKAEAKKELYSPKKKVSETLIRESLEDKAHEAIGALYGPDIWDNDNMFQLVNTLLDANPTDGQLNFIIDNGRLPRSLQHLEFPSNDDLQFGNGMYESKPSAGMTKKEKSAVVKKAVAGKDIGKPGKGFAKVEKAAAKGGAKDPKAVAAAAMWKQQAKK